MFRIRRSIPEPRLELTPLIDVVFLLLTFFIFSMVLMVRADVLDIALPELTAGESADDRTRIVVGVRSDGSVRVDGDPVESGSLAARIVELRAANPDAALVIAADQESRSGALLEVLDTLAAAGLTEFSIIGTPADRVPGTVGRPAEGSGATGSSEDQPPPASSSSNP